MPICLCALNSCSKQQVLTLVYEQQTLRFGDYYNLQTSVKNTTDRQTMHYETLGTQRITLAHDRASLNYKHFCRFVAQNNESSHCLPVSTAAAVPTAVTSVPAIQTDNKQLMNIATAAEQSYSRKLSRID